MTCGKPRIKHHLGTHHPLNWEIWYEWYIMGVWFPKNEWLMSHIHGEKKNKRWEIDQCFDHPRFRACFGNNPKSKFCVKRNHRQFHSHVIFFLEYPSYIVTFTGQLSGHYYHPNVLPCVGYLPTFGLDFLVNVSTQKIAYMAHMIWAIPYIEFTSLLQGFLFSN